MALLPSGRLRAVSVCQSSQPAVVLDYYLLGSGR
jgi:hypothetical protein